MCPTPCASPRRSSTRPASPGSPTIWNPCRRCGCCSGPTRPPPLPTGARRLDETPETFERRRMRAGLSRMDDALHRERDRLPFTRTERRGAAQIDRGAERRKYGGETVRKRPSYTPRPISPPPADRAYSKPEGIIVGSSNLTGAGLTPKPGAQSRTLRPTRRGAGSAVVRPISGTMPFTTIWLSCSRRRSSHTARGTSSSGCSGISTATRWTTTQPWTRTCR